MTAPQNETAAVVPPREGETALPGLPQDAALAPSSTPAGVAPQAEDTPPSAAVAAPEALPAGSAEASAAAAPPGNEPYAIPAAPDSNTPATAFLVNHEPKVYGEENADARIVLKANQDAWVQVRDRQGTLLLTRVLRVGDSYRVPNQGDLTLLTGNAGGLEIVVDGRALAPLGPVGAVRRNIPLDPQALTSGNARYRHSLEVSAVSAHLARNYRSGRRRSCMAVRQRHGSAPPGPGCSGRISVHDGGG